MLKMIGVLYFIFYITGCDRSTVVNPNEGKKITFDTTHLWQQIDSIDYFSSQNDTTNIYRLLQQFKDVQLARQFPKFIYQAYYYASNIDSLNLSDFDLKRNNYYAKLNQEIQQLALKANSEELLIYSDYLSARYLNMLGNNELAFPKFFSLLDRFTKVNDRYGQGLTNKRIGMIYFATYKQYGKAEYYFKEAYKISPGEVEKIANALFLVKTYFYQENFDSLSKYYTLFNSFSKYNTPEQIVEAKCYFHIYQYVNSKTGNTDSVNKYLAFMLDDCFSERQPFSLDDLLNYFPSYCNSLIDKRQFHLADSLIDIVINFINKNKILVDNSIGFYKTCNYYYDAIHNYKKAYYYLKLYNDAREKLNLEEKKNEVELARIDYQVEKQLRQSKSEQTQKEILNQQKLKTQKIIRNSFIAGTIMLMLLIVVLINRNKLKRAVEMEKMRSRLSRDLHDDIGSTLSSINILSRTAQTNLTQVHDEKTKTSLQKINERSQRLLDSMSDIIWNINPGNDTIEEVMSRMREYATAILEAKKIDYTFNFPRHKMDCRLSMEVKNNLYLIFKEAVNNLSKYSGCTHATLSLIFDEKNIHLSIEDNGIGFDEPEIKHRGGLVNMQQRATEIKGSISIYTEINKGTTIELTIPRYC